MPYRRRRCSHRNSAKPPAPDSASMQISWRGEQSNAAQTDRGSCVTAGEDRPDVRDLEEAEDDEIRHLFETNFFGLVAMARAVLPGMRAKGRGTIVNIPSVGGRMAQPDAGYCILAPNRRNWRVCSSTWASIRTALQCGWRRQPADANAGTESLRIATDLERARGR